ncbi:hypothetical protein FRB90_012663 [Tulasnella sp. 427]|nr:hypothetical protein FRB90_012663 [Tulasnella sp. 427]
MRTSNPKGAFAQDNALSRFKRQDKPVFNQREPRSSPDPELSKLSQKVSSESERKESTDSAEHDEPFDGTSKEITNQSGKLHYQAVDDRTVAAERTKANEVTESLHHLRTAVPFGYFKNVSSQKTIPVVMKDDNYNVDVLTVGRSSSCNICVPVRGSGIESNHCCILLHLLENSNGSITRKVQVLRWSSAPTWWLVTVKVDGKLFDVLDEPFDLSSGDQLRLGTGPWLKYHSPKASSVLPIPGGRPISGSGDGDFQFFEATRLWDNRRCLVKEFNESGEALARLELQVYKTLGPHRSLVQIIESIYDPDTRMHSPYSEDLIFELPDMTLRNLVASKQSSNRAGLRKHADRMIRQIIAGLCYVHGRGVAHRNLTPDNIMVFANSNDQFILKICNFEMARLKGRPEVKKWNGDIHQGSAPGSFRDYGSDYAVDSYAVGRILFDILTEYPWPTEPRETDRSCSCLEECEAGCVRRQAAFQHLVEENIEDRFVDFLKNVLVSDSTECMEVEEMIQNELFRHIAC